MDEAIFTETEIKHEWNVIPAGFPLVKAPLKHLFWYRMKLCQQISFNILKSSSWGEVSL